MAQHKKIPKTTQTTIHLKLDKDLHLKAARAARGQERTMQSLIRFALREYLESEGKR